MVVKGTDLSQTAFGSSSNSVIYDLSACDPGQVI